MSLTYKQIQHDVGNDDIKWAEIHESPGIISTVSGPVCVFIWGAEGWLNLMARWFKSGGVEGGWQEQRKKGFLSVDYSEAHKSFT